ncbi:LutC/YkgG family protein [Curvivirga aplysinae]|uniref:LutC/YkgG family protein n=1 Tax=Curvivirga aplysinae TaxID=2529852 RepID=UPI001C3FC18A|nr:LUD domain-containing protein [Curvivirga aplysinae]
MEKNMEARNQIFASIRRSKERGGVKSDPKAVEKRLAEHPSGLIPKRSQLEKAEQVNLFQKMAENVQASVVRLKSDREIPAAVSDYLAQKNLPARVKLSGDERLSNLPWSENASHISLLEGASGGDDLVSLAVSFAGIAETGTLVLHSGPKGPTTLNFLPETHMVVLRESDIVGAYEEAWARIRKQQADKGEEFLPRTVNMITGPSRTGDIEQTILLGAHGPHALHILMVADDA